MQINDCYNSNSVVFLQILLFLFSFCCFYSTYVVFIQLLLFLFFNFYIDS